MADRLKGKVAVVTGAARGIGAAIARTFVGEGVQLAALDLDRVALDEVARSWGEGVHTGTVDIAEQASVEAAFAAILKRFGRIDILVNNAGVNVFADPIAMTAEDWRRCLAVNLEGAWHCIRASLPGMLAAKSGSIVNIASTHAFSIIPGCFPYPVAKHGLLGLTRALAVEYAPQNVRINAIAPGYIETDKVKDWLADFPDPAAARRRVEDLIPLRRIGSPQEVAWAAVYLASAESGFTTGSMLVMDGGRSAVYHD
jgi:NAD(P)-dependent dehydrogenase (short-subunit alcohol dehydrogenase family)